MSTQSVRMLDDPLEPNYVRELLQAGATDTVTDYDYEKGLVKHMGLVAGGAFPPSWAESSGTATKVGTTSSMKMAALWLGVPIASVGVVAAVLLTGNELPWATSGKPKSAPIEQIATRTNAEMQKEPAVAQEKTTVGLDRQTRQQLKANVESPRRMPAQSYYTRHRNRSAIDPIVGARPTGNTKNRAEVSKYFSTNVLNSEVTPNPYLHKATRSGASFNKGEKQPVYNGVKNAASASERKAVPQEQRTQAPQAVEAVDTKTDKAEKLSISIQPFVEVEQKGSGLKEYNPSEKEISMVAMANRYLQSDPQRALDLALLGEREFPHGKGMLAQERRYIRVLSLIKLGRTDEARALGMKYLSHYPQGPFSDRIRRAFATGQVPEE